MDAAEELCAYGLGLLRRLTARPGDDLLSELVHTRSLEGVPTEQLFMAYWFPLAAGAFDTTASSLAGGLRALIEFPDQLARLRAEPRLVPTAVEEIVRWVSPVVYFRRTATADTELCGQRVRQGERVVLCYASANRDEEVFADPQRFDVGRTPNNHVSFGHGPHFCLGARLSSFVMRIFLEELLRRMPALRLDGEVVHTRSNWMNRIRSMPVARVQAEGGR
jgi:cytochrome P450